MKDKETKELKHHKEEQLMEKLLGHINCTKTCTDEEIAFQFSKAVNEMNGTLTHNTTEFKDMIRQAEADAKAKNDPEVDTSNRRVLMVDGEQPGEKI